MLKRDAFIKKIEQSDNNSFHIEWSDQTTKNYKLSHLQRNCPCAGCVDEHTGQRRENSASVADDVRAVRILSVGRYALRIQFTSGCSNGIYSFNHLRKL